MESSVLQGVHQDVDLSIRSYDSSSHQEGRVNGTNVETMDICSNGNLTECNLITREYTASDHWFGPHAEVFLVICYCIVIVFGIIGNSAICFVVTRFKHLRRPRNILILNLSVCDIIMCVFCIPFSLVRLTLKNWRLGDILCRLSPTLQCINVFVSTFTIVAIAVDRYSAIVCASRENTHKSLVYYFICLIWLVAIFLCVPMLVFHDIHLVNSNVLDIPMFHICMEMWPGDTLKKAFTTVVLLVQYVFPLVTISILHARICKVLRSRINGHPKTESEMNRVLREVKRHKKNMLLLSAIALSFAIAWLPLTVMNALADFDDNLFMDKNLHYTYAYCLLVALCSSCLNPIVYGWFNSNFRQAFLMVLCCWRKDCPDNMEMATIKTQSLERSLQRPFRNYSSFQLSTTSPSKKSSSKGSSPASSVKESECRGGASATVSAEH